MTQLPSLSKEIGDIYFIANTPSSFYKRMRENYFIQTSLAILPTQTLIEEFNKLANTPLDSFQEIANVYAIYIALTFKEPSEVKHFFENSLSIKFEWFAEIAKYYLQNPTPVISYNTFNVNSKVTSKTVTTTTTNQPIKTQQVKFG